MSDGGRQAFVRPTREEFAAELRELMDLLGLYGERRTSEELARRLRLADSDEPTWPSSNLIRTFWKADQAVPRPGQQPSERLVRRVRALRELAVERLGVALSELAKEPEAGCAESPRFSAAGVVAFVEDLPARWLRQCQVCDAIFISPWRSRACHRDACRREARRWARRHPAERNG